MIMNPIENGHFIFSSILNQGDEHFYDINDAKKLIDKLLIETEGWVILDFLDYGGWDRITSVEIVDEEYLKLTYRNLEGSSNAGLILHFQDLYTLVNENLSAIFIRGYSIKKDDVKKRFEENASSFKFVRNRNFSIEFVRTINGMEETYQVMTSPIYSFAILPKDTPLQPQNSQEVLFYFNFGINLSRLEKVKEKLEGLSPNDFDEIRSLGNTTRVIFESVLKIEVCTLEHHVSFLGYKKPRETNFKKDYNKLMLKDLKGFINKFMKEEKRQEFNKMIDSCNTHSHDSGFKIQKEEILELVDSITKYTSNLLDLSMDYKKLNEYYCSNLEKIKIDTSVFKKINFSEIKIEDD